MKNNIALKFILFAVSLTASILGDTASAQRGSFQNNQSIQRNHHHPSKDRRPNIHGGTLVVPGPPVIVEEVEVPVEVVIVEHNDTIYRTIFYDANPIKGHFTTYAGLQFTRGNTFKPGFDAGCRADWYREKKNFAGYASLDFKYQLSHYWVDQAEEYTHNSFHYVNLDFHYGPRFICGNGSVIAFGIGPIVGISPYGRTVNQNESYSTFKDKDFSNRVQSGIDFEVTYAHKNLFLGLEINKFYTPYDFEIDANGMGLGFCFNAGYRFGKGGRK